MQKFFKELYERLEPVYVCLVGRDNFRAGELAAFAEGVAIDDVLGLHNGSIFKSNGARLNVVILLSRGG